MDKHITSIMTQKSLALRRRLTKFIVGFYFLLLSLGVPFVNPIHAAPQSSLSLSMHNQQVSATISRAPLEEVLTRLTAYGPIRFVIKGDVKNNKISSSFRHLSLQESLETLLLGYDYAIIQRQIGPTPQISELPYLMEVVVLSRNEAKPNSINERPSLIDPQKISTQPSLLHASNILKESIPTKPLEIETNNDESNFQATIEEALQDSDPKSLALLNELLEE